MKPRVAILISGNGSTLQALLDCRDFIHITVVISSKTSAYGVIRAQRAGVPVEVCKSEDEIQKALEKYRVQKIFLAGFMKIVSDAFVERWKDKIFNIHPSLLPKYKGLSAYQEACKAGEKEAGVTIHHVSSELDSGLICRQRAFEIPKNENQNIRDLYLHIQENRILRQTVREVLWPR